MAQWKLTDNSTGTPVEYNFYVNPKTQGFDGRKANVTSETSTAPNGQVLLFQGRDKVPTFKFSGHIISSAQYSDMNTWLEKPYPMVLTDDQSRAWTVLITSYTLERVKRANNQYRFDYNVDGLIIA